MKLSTKTIGKLLKGGDPAQMLAEDMKEKGARSEVFTLNDEGVVTQKSYSENIVEVVKTLVDQKKELTEKLKDRESFDPDLIGTLRAENSELSNVIAKYEQDCHAMNLRNSELDVIIKDQTETIKTLSDNIQEAAKAEADEAQKPKKKSEKKEAGKEAKNVD